MHLSTQIANQFRDAQLSGKWITPTNLKNEIMDVDWKEATTKIGSLNTIAALAFHINYYVEGLIKVFEGGPLDIRDKYSYDMPSIQSKEDWEKLRNKICADAERFAEYVENLPEEKISAPFIEEKYGNYFRNLTGQIEHTYYHLGQMVLIKKMIREGVNYKNT